MKKRTVLIVMNALPILLMIGLIPFITNDYVLTVTYIVMIVCAFMFHRQKGEVYIFLFGFCVMILSESIFVHTGVETFVRNSLFGVMPSWLPFLWGYSFVAIKRAITILEI